MESAAAFDLQVIICSGREDANRARVGLGLALAAASSGSRVVVWLTGNAKDWLPSDAENFAPDTDFESVTKNLDLIREAGGVVEACSKCIEEACSLESNGSTAVATDVQLAGMATVAIRMTTTPTVTF